MAIITTVMLAGTLFAGTAQAAPTTTKKTFTSTTPAAIPDWAPHVDAANGLGNSYIFVSGISGNITKVTASVYISHGNVGDLDAAIVGPDGTSFSYLFTSAALTGTSLGTSCNDADRTTFDDSAGTSIDAGAPPYVGSFQTMNTPSQGLVPLSVFNGSANSADGMWVFDVVDSAPGNTGTIECWSLFVETDQAQSLRFDSPGAATIDDAVVESGGPGVASSPIMATGLPGGISSVTASVYITRAKD